MKNIIRRPAIYWIVNKLIRAKQRFMALMVLTIRAVSIGPFNMPSFFMEIYSDGKVT